MLPQVYNVPEELVKRMQDEEERGLIVMGGERMSFIQPEEEGEQEQGRGERDYGLGGTLCTMKTSCKGENRREADIYSRQAGKVNIVDSNKFPMLNYVDMSAEKGTLFPNAMLSLHWSRHGHKFVYVTMGDAQAQIVDQNKQALMNDRVSQGDMFVVPQYYASMAQAGNNGCEWVVFKTTRMPMFSMLTDYTSVIRAMPLEVLTNEYGMSAEQAQELARV